MFHPRNLFVAVLFVGLMLALTNVSSAAVTQTATVTGIFNIVWGDTGPDSKLPPTENYFVTDDSGITSEILLDDITARAAGGVLSLNRQRVRVFGSTIPRTTGMLPAVQSLTIQRTGPEATANLMGPQPWITVGCKFADYADEPRSPDYLQSMYSSDYPGLDHYWREQSYNNITLTGSAAAAWFTMPYPMSHYATTDGNLDMTLAWQGCLGAADATVNFANYAGINMMFNRVLGNYSYGGSGFLNLDGVQRGWGLTWLLPWAYTSIVGTEHEMGHGFGLPHSSGNYGQVYDNQWDVMSDMWSNCYRATDPMYGCLGQHTIAWHKSLLGWIPSTGNWGGVGILAVWVDTLAMNHGWWTFQLEVINSAADPTHYYLLEARGWVGYDVKLPGEGVIIHERNTATDGLAHIVDVDNNGNTGDAGAVWTPGEVFADPAREIYFCIVEKRESQYLIFVGDGVVPPCAASTPTPTQTRTLTQTPTPKFTPDGNWIYCANENKTCNLPGTRLVRFGANGKYLYKLLVGSFVCIGATFGGDPAVGVVKHCDYNSVPDAPTPTNTPTKTLTPTATFTATPTETVTPTATEGLACQAKPARPGLISPKDGALIRKGQATLKWETAACADSYTLVIVDKATNQRVEKVGGMNLLSYQTKKLLPGHTYRWQVMAVNAFGRTASKVREMTTK